MAATTLNVALLKKVRRAIWDPNNPTGFDMRYWFTGSRGNLASEAAEYGQCGTTACIAGHAAGIMGSRFNVEEVAQDALGLSNHDADYLFRGRWAKQGDIHDTERPITKTETLRYLAKCIKAKKIVRV